MKYYELKEEIEEAYKEYMRLHPLNNENVDFDSFVVGYTMCMHMRDTKKKE
jgi:hypothetical protein